MSPLTQLQRDWLVAAPESFDRIPIEIGSGTLATLLDRGLVEACHGLGWRRTEKGRVIADALRMEREAVSS